MSQILLFTGIVLVAVPLVLMIGFAGVIFVSFMKDDDVTSNIMTVALVIMVTGVMFIVGSFLEGMV